MTLTEQSVIVMANTVVSLFVGVMAAYLRSQISLLKSTQETHLQEMKLQLIEKIDQAAVDRTRNLADMRQAMMEMVQTKTNGVVTQFVPIKMCEFMHDQMTDKLMGFTTRLDKVERLVEEVETTVDECNRKLDFLTGRRRIDRESGPESVPVK